MSKAMHVVCPHCGVVNRIPDARLKDKPGCGRCHHPLFNGYPVELTALNFQRHVERNDIPLLVDFWAAWCGPCQTMATAFQQAAAQLEPAMRLAKLSTESARTIAVRLGIRSIPTLVMFQGGRELAREEGAMNASEIMRWVRSCG